MNIVLAHDSYTQYGGAERVMEALHELYPASPVMTLVADKKMKQHMLGWDVRTSPLQWLYEKYPHFQHLFPFIPIALRFFYITDHADILLSSSSSFIKGIPKPAGSKHVNYCHTPTRFLWVDPEHAYREIPKILHVPAKFYMRWLRNWDYRKAQSVDYFIANSEEVKKRIAKYYGRESEVIQPFVDTEFWKPVSQKQNYFLVAGRLQYAKGIDTVIQVCNDLKLPLHVVGTGRYESHLRSIAGPTVVFLGKITDEQLRIEYSGARAFIYPQLEDFGIMPLEAAACGTATIGLNRGGTLETVVRGETGELIETMSSEALTSTLQIWNEAKYNESKLIAQARNFSKEIFQKKIREFINKVI